jgi:hypothetical protein
MEHNAGMMTGATAVMDTKGEWITLTPWVNGVGYGTMYLSPTDAREMAQELEAHAKRLEVAI